MILRRETLAGGRDVEIAELLPTDHEWAYSLAVDPERSASWRNRGRPPSPAEFPSLLLGGGVRHTAVARSGGQRLALLQLLGDERDDGHLDLSVLAAERHALNSVAVASYLSFAFDTLRLRKVYLASSARSLEQIGDLAAFATQEGCLLDHLVVTGSLVDVKIFGVLPADVGSYLARLRAVGDRALLDAWLADRPWIDEPSIDPAGATQLADRLDSLDLTELTLLVEDVVGRPVDAGALLACGDRAEIILLTERLSER